MIREITSATNPFIKELRALTGSKKARQESGTFIVEGRRGIETLIQHPSEQYRLETLVVSNDWNLDDPIFQTLETVETIAVPGFVFEKISDVKNAQGILGVVHHTPAPFAVNPDRGNYLLLDSIGDPGNLGTLIRSAVGAGFAGILLHGDCVEHTNPKVIRSTMGTFPSIGIWTVGKEEIFQCLENGYELAATAGRDGENLYQAEFTDKTILVIGSEAHGVSPEIFELAKRRITIPIAPGCESLNAAVAGSICMFQITNG